MLRRIISPLGLLQIAALLSFAIIVGDVAVAMWHQTDDYFTPLVDYLGSFRVALPPAAIFGLSYIIAFVTGASITDAPKTALGFCRNRLLQSVMGMALVIGSAAVITAYCGYLVYFVTPPAYEKFVEVLLGSSSDNSLLVKDRIDVINKKNPALAEQLSKVVEVFAERSAVNAGTKPLITERAKVLVRSLEAHVSPEWDAHPLRWHGLAEAYLLYAQSAEQAGQGLPPTSALQTPYQRAVALYSDVVSSKSPLTPPLLKASARNNLGNAYYYTRDYEKALAAWRVANSAALGRTNLSSWGNIIAALILLDRYDEAIEEGTKAEEWATTSGKAMIEPYQYAGVVGNLAFAKLQTGNVAGALADFATAHAFQEDDLTRQNLALALIFNKKYPEAQGILRQIAPPAQPDDQMEIVSKGKVTRCVYLIWALADPAASAPHRAANLFAFLNEAHSRAELNSYSPQGLVQLQVQVTHALPSAAPPCGSLGKIKAVTDLIQH